MLKRNELTGNKTDNPDFLKVLLTLKANIMKDLNVCEICKVVDISKDSYVVNPINNTKEKLYCKTITNSTLNKGDLVLVIFTNSDYRLNLKKIKAGEKPQEVAQTDLHSRNYGVIIATGSSSPSEVYSKVYVNGNFAETFNADTKANVDDLNTKVPKQDFVTHSLVTDVNGGKYHTNDIIYVNSKLSGYDSTGNFINKSEKDSPIIRKGNYIIFSGNANDITTIDVDTEKVALKEEIPVIKAGTNINITTSGNEITINAETSSGGTNVYVNNVKQDAINFTSDPQTQITNNTNAINDMLLSCWPVNSVYISVESTSPSAFIGGTWEQLPEGYALWTIVTGVGGDTIASGLPDITGYVHSIVAAATWDNQPTWGGAFTLGKNVLDIQGPQRDGYRRYLKPMDFAASKSNSIYGSSDTVQPPAIKVYAWKRVF